MLMDTFFPLSPWERGKKVSINISLTVY